MRAQAAAAPLALTKTPQTPFASLVCLYASVRAFAECTPAFRGFSGLPAAVQSLFGLFKAVRTSGGSRCSPGGVASRRRSRTGEHESGRRFSRIGYFDTIRTDGMGTEQSSAQHSKRTNERTPLRPNAVRTRRIRADRSAARHSTPSAETFCAGDRCDARSRMVRRDWD
jgi:hypothetical protein